MQYLDSLNDKQKEAVEAAAFFGDLPTKCGKCGCTDLTFTVRRPETYVYYGLKCKGCLAEFGFGQYKDQSGLFPKFNEGWKTWEERKADTDQAGGTAPQSRGTPPPRGAGQAARPTTPPKRGSADPNEEDDIPF